MIDGCNSRATANKARTDFSPSPTYLKREVKTLCYKNHNDTEI